MSYKRLQQYKDYNFNKNQFQPLKILIKQNIWSFKNSNNMDIYEVWSCRSLLHFDALSLFPEPNWESKGWGVLGPPRWWWHCWWLPGSPSLAVVPWKFKSLSSTWTLFWALDLVTSRHQRLYRSQTNWTSVFTVAASPTTLLPRGLKHQ